MPALSSHQMDVPVKPGPAWPHRLLLSVQRDFDLRRRAVALHRRLGHPGLEYPGKGILLEFVERIGILRMREHQKRSSVSLVSNRPHQEHSMA
jgi:hypothetical protein